MDSSSQSPSNLGSCPLSEGHEAAAIEWKRFEGCAEDLLKYIKSYVDSVPHRRVFPNVEPGFMRKLLPDTAPDDPDSWEDVLKDIERVIMPGAVHWRSPKFFAYFPAANSYPSMLADMLCNAIGAVVFTWATFPSATELEVMMMDWLGKMLSLPDTFLYSGSGKGGGLIQTTASEVVLVSLLSARSQALKKEREKDTGVTVGQVLDRLVGYCSDQAHCSVMRAGSIGAVRMRKLETDEKGSLRGETLETAILEDKAKGLLPFFLCATLGSTDTCAFDPLTELGPVSMHSEGHQGIPHAGREHGLWMHVDAAYAGGSFICPELRPLLNGVEFADSFNFNAHKWLRVRMNCSLLWVQNTDYLYFVPDADAEYLNYEKKGIMPDLYKWRIGLGYKFNSLRLWFVLRMLGRKKLQESIRKDVSLAHQFEALVNKDDRFEIIADVVVGLVCFRLKGPNDLTERLLLELNKRSEIHLVHSRAKGVFFLRLAIACYNSESHHIQFAWDVIKAAADLLDADQ